MLGPSWQAPKHMYGFTSTSGSPFAATRFSNSVISCSEPLTLQSTFWQTRQTLIADLSLTVCFQLGSEQIHLIHLHLLDPIFFLNDIAQRCLVFRRREDISDVLFVLLWRQDIACDAVGLANIFADRSVESQVWRVEFRLAIGN